MEIAPLEFREVQSLARTLCGLVLTDDKTYLVRTRLEPVVLRLKCGSFAEYLAKLRDPGATGLRDELVESLTTGETSFFRDEHPFTEFRQRILPELAEKIRKRREERYPIPACRIWSAGCSTGQEPYSISMSIADYIAGNPALGLRLEHFPILATDVSAKSLAIAREGRYAERDLERRIPMDQRSRHFTPRGDQWVVRDELRRTIDFRRLNFVSGDVNLGPFDAIFCRNVLIYFDAAIRQRLCDLFFQLLNPDGLLILGSAESLYGLTTPFVSGYIGRTLAFRKPSR